MVIFLIIKPTICTTYTVKPVKQYHVPVTAAGQVPGQAMLTDTIRRHEVDLVLSNQNAILSTARDIK